MREKRLAQLDENQFRRIYNQPALRASVNIGDCKSTGTEEKRRGIIITKEAPSKRSELLCSLWLKVLVLEFLDSGFLAAEAAQIVDA